MSVHWAADDPDTARDDCEPVWEPVRQPNVTDLPDISEWRDMTNDDRQRRLYERPLARAHALAEQWTGDQTPITRSEAAELLNQVLDSHGWTETTAPSAHLAAVPDRPTTCPSDCDPDCDVDCHEEHAVPWKRHHDPATCPSRTGAPDA